MHGKEERARHRGPPGQRPREKEEQRHRACGMGRHRVAMKKPWCAAAHVPEKRVEELHRRAKESRASPLRRPVRHVPRIQQAGWRVQREISGYAQLSQAAMESTRMIADNVTQWKLAADGLRNS